MAKMEGVEGVQQKMMVDMPKDYEEEVVENMQTCHRDLNADLLYVNLHLIVLCHMCFGLYYYHVRVDRSNIHPLNSAKQTLS